MRFIPYLCALLLGVGAALFAGCGNRGNLIPAGDGDAVKAELSAVQEAVDAGECGQAEAAVTRARSAVDNLPESVDARLKSRLKGGLGDLSSKARQECAAEPETTTTQVPTTETTPPEETTPEETEPTVPTEPTDTGTEPITPVNPTLPGDGTGDDPTDPGTGTDPVPDPGGASPEDPDPGSGFRVAPGRSGTGPASVFENERRDRRGSQGYIP